MSSTIKLPKFCNYCGVAFIAQKTTTKYCSHRCNNAALKKAIREEKVNTEFKRQQNKIVASIPTENIKIISTSNTENSLNLKDKEFLSIQEVATLLGASRWTIQRMIKSKRLQSAKLGSRTIIKRTSIDNLFN